MWMICWIKKVNNPETALVDNVAIISGLSSSIYIFVSGHIPCLHAQNLALFYLEIIASSVLIVFESTLMGFNSEKTKYSFELCHYSNLLFWLYGTESIFVLKLFCAETKSCSCSCLIIINPNLETFFFISLKPFCVETKLCSLLL